MVLYAGTRQFILSRFTTTYWIDRANAPIRDKTWTRNICRSTEKNEIVQSIAHNEDKQRDFVQQVATKMRYSVLDWSKATNIEVDPFSISVIWESSYFTQLIRGRDSVDGFQLSPTPVSFIRQ